MFIPEHALPVALAIDGLTLREPTANGQLREAVALARAARCTLLQLDGKLPGLRARELDRSARREVAAILRREGLGLSGIDLWIPPAHFSQSQHVDRATEAVREACSLAADVARLLGSTQPLVCIELPADARDGVLDAIATAASSAGTLVADFGQLVQSLTPAVPVGGPIGLGFDPAADLLAGRDPTVTLAALGRRVITARLTDAQNFGRCTVGLGRLDIAAFKATLAVATSARSVTLDLRGVSVGLNALKPSVNAWTGV